jgi:hypothetical protein
VLQIPQYGHDATVVIRLATQPKLVEDPTDVVLDRPDRP